MDITKRRISFRNGTEGPSHDPYSVRTTLVYINEDVISLEEGSLSGVSLSRNNHVIFQNVQDAKPLAYVEIMFEEMTGVRIVDLEKYHEKWLDRNPHIREMMQIDRDMRANMY